MAATSKSPAPLTIQPPSDAVPLTSKGAAGQTANLQEWQDSTGTPLASVAADGAVTVPDAAYGVGWDGATTVPTKNAVYDKVRTLHASSAATYISGTGTAGTDGTAMTVKTVTLPANTLTQVGDRLHVRTYWKGDTGSAITGSVLLGPAAAEVLISHTTDSGATDLQINETWLHYIDATHANIIENEAGALGALSDVNVAGFGWAADQSILFTQSNAGNNHCVLYAFIIDVFPKG